MLLANCKPWFHMDFPHLLLDSYVSLRKLILNMDRSYMPDYIIYYARTRSKNFTIKLIYLGSIKKEPIIRSSI